MMAGGGDLDDQELDEDLDEELVQVPLMRVEVLALLQALQVARSAMARMEGLPDRLAGVQTVCRLQVGLERALGWRA